MRKIMITVSGLVSAALLAAYGESKEQKGFPFTLPETKPDRELSAAVARNYDNFATARPEDNELFSQFKYTELDGLDYNDFDGTITRRDPSKVLFRNSKYCRTFTTRSS